MIDYNVQVPEQLISDDDLDQVLACFYEEDDWHNGKPCNTLRNLSDHFVNREVAKETINRILTALNRVRNQ